MVTLDDPCTLERPHAPQAGRRGYAGTFGQLHIGHAPVCLQVADDAPIDPIELCTSHQFPPLAALYARTMPGAQ
jgi:hypothetical protein